MEIIMIKFKSAAGFFIKALSLTIGIIILEVIFFGGSLVVPTLLIGGAISIFGALGELLHVRNVSSSQKGFEDDSDVFFDDFENSPGRNLNSIHNNALNIRFELPELDDPKF